MITWDYDKQTYVRWLSIPSIQVGLSRSVSIENSTDRLKRYNVLLVSVDRYGWCTQST